MSFHFYHYLTSFVSDCFQIALVYFFFFFQLYWKYTIIPGDCNDFRFICLCNKDYGIEKTDMSNKGLYQL